MPRTAIPSARRVESSTAAFQAGRMPKASLRENPDCAEGFMELTRNPSLKPDPSPAKKRRDQDGNIQGL